MLKTFFSVGAVLLLTGCSVTAPVRGQVQNSKETFTGTTTGYMDRSGTIEATLNNGVKCSGNFVYSDLREGSGVITCEDGRSGPFTFVSTGRHGTGTGDFGPGQRFTFTFGE